MVRFGIIGYGSIGGLHENYLSEGLVENAVLTAICDIRETQLQKAKEKLGDTVKLFSNHHDLIASGECDAVIVSTPHYDHPTISIDCLKAGLHVIVEKPAGVYAKAVYEMNEVAKESGKVFSIMYCLRTADKFMKIKEMVEGGELGEIKRVNWIATDWYRPQAYHDSSDWRSSWKTEGGGLLINQCPHNLDILQWIFGVPDEITAHCEFGKYYNIEVEDDMTVHMHYNNGLSCVFVASTGEAPGTNRLEVAGSRGQLILEDNRLTFKRTAVDEREFNRTTKERMPKLAWETIDIPVAPQGAIHQKITQNFVNAIEHGEALIAPGENGINEMNISNAIHMSAWTKQTVSLPVDPDKFYAMLQDKINGK